MAWSEVMVARAVEVAAVAALAVELAALAVSAGSLVATSGGRQALEALRARAASGAVGRHEELFDSVLGCIGYQSPDGGLNPGNNWCQPAAGRKPA